MSKRNWREFDDPSTIRSEVLPTNLDKSEWNVRVQRTRGGRNGKTVTLISGLKLNDSEARSLLKGLKSRCGTGGTVKGDLLELQGDQVDVIMEFLTVQGYRPKKSGG